MTGIAKNSKRFSITLRGEVLKEFLLTAHDKDIKPATFGSSLIGTEMKKQIAKKKSDYYDTKRAAEVRAALYEDKKP